MRSFPIWGTFAVSEATGSGGTAFTALIPPYRGPAYNPLYVPSAILPGNPGPQGGYGTAGSGSAYTHVNTLLYTTGATAHKVGIMRPLNWTTFAAAVPKNTTAITLTADPGKYSTNFNYQTPGGVVPAIADDTIVTGDYVAYQYADGTWQIDTIASGTFAGANLVLTTGTANQTGAVIPLGGILYYFGIIGDIDPNTGVTNWQTTLVASQARASLLQEGVLGEITSAHRGDPMIFYSPNTTNAGLMNHMAGYYSPRGG